jgi:site-specific recombinase XerD
VPNLSVIQKSNELSKLPTVKSFLDSIRHGSVKSMNSYASALVHFQNFLDKRYISNNNDNQGYNCETIIKPLIENKINIYELFNGFVSYMLLKTDHDAVTNTTTVTISSINFYLAAIRSYFAYYDIDVIPSKFRRKVKVPKVPREDEQPLDIEDIRKILLSSSCQESFDEYYGCSCCPSL